MEECPGVEGWQASRLCEQRTVEPGVRLTEIQRCKKRRGSFSMLNRRTKTCREISHKCWSWQPGITSKIRETVQPRDLLSEHQRQPQRLLLANPLRRLHSDPVRLVALQRQLLPRLALLRSARLQSLRLALRQRHLHPRLVHLHSVPSQLRLRLDLLLARLHLLSVPLQLLLRLGHHPPRSLQRLVLQPHPRLSDHQPHPHLVLLHQRHPHSVLRLLQARLVQRPRRQLSALQLLQHSAPRRLHPQRSARLHSALNLPHQRARSEPVRLARRRTRLHRHQALGSASRLLVHPLQRRQQRRAVSVHSDQRQPPHPRSQVRSEAQPSQPEGLDRAHSALRLLLLLNRLRSVPPRHRRSQRVAGSELSARLLQLLPYRPLPRHPQSPQTASASARLPSPPSLDSRIRTRGRICCHRWKNCKQKVKRRPRCWRRSQTTDSSCSISL